MLQAKNGETFAPHQPKYGITARKLHQVEAIFPLKSLIRSLLFQTLPKYYTFILGLFTFQNKFMELFIYARHKL